jgi:hypothetical protein
MWLYQCSKNNKIVCTKRGLASWQLKPPPSSSQLGIQLGQILIQEGLHTANGFKFRAVFVLFCIEVSVKTGCLAIADGLLCLSQAVQLVHSKVRRRVRLGTICRQRECLGTCMSEISCRYDAAWHNLLCDGAGAL